LSKWQKVYNSLKLQKKHRLPPQIAHCKHSGCAQIWLVQKSVNHSDGVVNRKSLHLKIQSDATKMDVE